MRKMNTKRLSFHLFFFFLEKPFKAATCVYLAASPCHSHTSTRSKWVVPYFTGTVITIVVCFVQAGKKKKEKKGGGWRELEDWIKNLTTKLCG